MLQFDEDSPLFHVYIYYCILTWLIYIFLLLNLLLNKGNIVIWICIMAKNIILKLFWNLPKKP